MDYEIQEQFEENSFVEMDNTAVDALDAVLQVRTEIRAGRRLIPCL
jgi:hypothetical protein